MGRTQTVQSTGKRWKLLQGIGCAGTLLGLTVLGFGIALAADAGPEERAKTAAFAAMLLVGSVPVYVLGRAGAWWFHG